MKKITPNYLRKLVNEVMNESQTVKRSSRRDYSISKALYEDASFEDVYVGKDTTYGTTPAEKVAKQEKGKDNKFLSMGDGKKDKVDARMGGISGKASDFSPSQNEVKYGKALGFALSMLRDGDFQPGGDLGGIATKDKRILDGHHRWAGTYLVNPGIQVQAAAVDLPFDQAIPVLRAIGLALGHVEGNMGGGKSMFGKAETWEQFKQDVKEKMADNPSKFGGPHTKENLTKGIAKHMGIEKDAQGWDDEDQAWMKQLYDNYVQLTQADTTGLPARIDMPVLVAGGGEDERDDKGNLTSQASVDGSNEVEFAIDALNKGDIDVKSTYSGELEKAADGNVEDATDEEEDTESGNQDSGNLMEGRRNQRRKELSRWMKLAGI